MRVAGIIQDSIVDGPGLRFVVFAQGCHLRCDGCHNPGTWDLSGGTDMTTDEIIAQMRRNPLTDGLTLSGGEPFLQAAECVTLAKAARDDGLNVWIYTGYTFEELLAQTQNSHVRELLELTDILVDGPFELSGRSLNLKWRGSRNQRVLDVPRSIADGHAVEKTDITK